MFGLRLRLVGAMLLLAALSLHSEVKPDKGLEAAKQAYEMSDYAGAVQLLQAAGTADPGNGEVQLWLTRAYYELHEHDAAISSGEKAVSIDPQNSKYHEWLARAYGLKAEHSSFLSALSWAKKTRKEFETAIKLDSRNLVARQALVEYDCSAPGVAGGGEDKARTEIAEIAAIDPAEGHYAAGNCRRQKKDFAAADEEFTKALQGHPQSLEVIYDIGDYALRRSQPDRLIAVAVAGEAVSSSDPRGKFYRAAAFVIRNERAAEAERLLHDYLKVAPTRTAFPRPAVAHYWLGLLYQQQGRTKEAASEYEHALQLDPKNKPAQEALKKIRKN
jgi:tetratricopeptide (TPR) repeat protein